MGMLKENPMRDGAPCAKSKWDIVRKAITVLVPEAVSSTNAHPQLVLVTPCPAEVDKQFEKLLECEGAGCMGPTALCLPCEDIREPDDTLEIQLIPSSDELDNEFARLLEERKRKPQLQVKLQEQLCGEVAAPDRIGLPDAEGDASCHATTSPRKTLEKSQTELEADFERLLQESKRKPQLPLRLPDEDEFRRGLGTGLASAPGALQQSSRLHLQPTLAEVDKQFEKLLHSASRKPRLALRLPEEQEDCIRYSRNVNIAITPTPDEVDKELDRVMEKGLFGTQRASPGPLSIPEPCEGDGWMLATETLPTPCAQEVDADFGKLLQSPKPQLPLQIPCEVEPCSNCLVMTPAPEQVDMDFSRLLASQSSSGGLKKPNLSVSPVECEEASLTDPVSLETPCLASVERDFDKLLLQEGSPSIITKPTVEVPTTSDGLKEPIPVILEEPCCVKKVDQDFEALLQQENGAPIIVGRSVTTKGAPKLMRSISLEVPSVAPVAPTPDGQDLPRVEEPTAAQMDQDFDKLLNSARPRSLARTPTVEIPTDTLLTQPTAPVLLEEASPEAVDQQFDQLLRQGPPALARTPTVEIPVVEVDELAAERAAPVVLEAVCPQAMEADFDRLLRQGPPTLARTPTLELPALEPLPPDKAAPGMAEVPLEEPPSLEGVDAD
eukprot:CAMPEP_0118942298 /NCGR_PEP_ID=MMETSP1169-20130426/35917_1 /TAXON_ID=36882 /ORGANISM="Pyramimonas obovata, Strain CCMP722" /LENGTH=665 /DNA_ID=CAMNT_0006887299 /DNA_START=173 /DNA_END=2167 /DNA_ORIENTATION=-